MSEAYLLILALGVPAVGIVFAGWRQRWPAWVVGGCLLGWATFAAGLVWAAASGMSALWAAIVAALGATTMAQTEALWWRRRRDR